MIINLTQHNATQEQVADGVIEPADKKAVQELLTFTEAPTRYELIFRAACLAQIAFKSGCSQAMIGGAPYLMSSLENGLNRVGITPVYSFSERVSEEQTQPDGSVKKVNVFKHVRFVEV